MAYALGHDRLHGSRLKIARAWEHLQELKDEILPFMEAHPYRTSPEFDAKRKAFAITVRSIGPEVPIPERFGLLAGDVAHCLRSALDLMVARLTDDLRSQFPIVDDEKDWDREDGRFLKGVLDPDRAAIRDLQPYHVKASAIDGTMGIDWRLLLLLIARLDNMGKHRLIPTVYGVSQFEKPRFTNVRSANGYFADEWVAVKDGAVVYWLTSIDVIDPNVSVESEPSFTVSFGQGPLDPEVMRRTLWNDRFTVLMGYDDLVTSARFVEKIIEGMEATSERLRQ